MLVVVVVVVYYSNLGEIKPMTLALGEGANNRNINSRIIVLRIQSIQKRERERKKLNDKIANIDNNSAVVETSNRHIRQIYLYIYIYQQETKEKRENREDENLILVIL